MKSVHYRIYNAIQNKKEEYHEKATIVNHSRTLHDHDDHPDHADRVIGGTSAQSEGIVITGGSILLTRADEKGQAIGSGYQDRQSVCLILPICRKRLTHVSLWCIM